MNTIALSLVVLRCIHMERAEEFYTRLEDWPGAVLSPPKDSEWGRRAVVTDPDGHRVELLQL